MRNKKVRRSRATPVQADFDVGSVWLAGVGAVSLARKQGRALLVDFVAEGKRLQNDALDLVRETRADARAQVTGWVTPVRAGLRRRIANAGRTVESGLAGARTRLGIPSKADIDELTQRVATLSRQLKSAGR